MQRAILILGVVLGSAWLCTESAGGVAARPNVLFILTDDLGWRDLGCYGSSFHETPHLDRLASQGLLFWQAYSAGAVCSPTRASIMTGKYPARVGITDYIPGDRAKGRKLLEPEDFHQLPLAETTLGEAFKEAGYQTFYGGKWHLGGKGFEPDAQGFEVCAGDDQLGDYGKDWRVGQRLTDAVVRFLDERDRAKPFFAFVGYHETHTPVLQYPAHIERCQSRAANLPKQEPRFIREREGRTRVAQDDPAYASETAGLDEQVGRLLAALEERGLTSSTIVVFTSDNGGLSTTRSGGPTSNQPLRAGKGWLYEGGIRVPLLVCVPGLTKPGSASDAPVISTDFYPTLLELVGLPAKPKQHLDGKSFVGSLRGRPAARGRRLFWHYPHYHGSTWAPGAALRDGDWKLIEFYDEGTAELYDLSTDRSEKHELASAKPAKLQALRRELQAWQKSVNAQMPKPNPDYQPRSQPTK